MYRRSWFNRFAKWSAHAAGHPLAFAIAVLIIIVWAATGPIFGFGDTWQLVINTSTTIITFLMVFLIQNSQNRDGAALQIKLDELIRAVEGAHNALLDLEELEENDLETMRTRYLALAADARKKLEEGLDDVGCPEPERGLSASEETERLATTSSKKPDRKGSPSSHSGRLLGTQQLGQRSAPQGEAADGQELPP